MSLSVIVITKNEAVHIGACLDSVAFADEIIVVDSGSTDDTCEIAASRGALIATTEDWPGFGPQKNRALDLASKEWVLSIDADERVTPELAEAIQRELSAPRADAYMIARLSNFGGRWIRHSGWWPDRVLRLFRRGTARFKEVAVHESVVPQTAPRILDGHFLHYPYASLEAFIAKINLYSSEAAQVMHQQGRRSSAPIAFGHALWTFLRHYLLRRGFLDGWQGLVLAGMAATGSYYRYVKLLFLNRSVK
jgi:glycosyltransferase involved in cell wall biosynthesis